MGGGAGRGGGREQRRGRRPDCGLEGAQVVHLGERAEGEGWSDHEVTVLAAACGRRCWGLGETKKGPAIRGWRGRRPGAEGRRRSGAWRARLAIGLTKLQRDRWGRGLLWEQGGHFTLHQALHVKVCLGPCSAGRAPEPHSVDLTERQRKAVRASWRRGAGTPQDTQHAQGGALGRKSWRGPEALGVRESGQGWDSGCRL